MRQRHTCERFVSLSFDLRCLLATLIRDIFDTQRIDLGRRQGSGQGRHR